VTIRLCQPVVSALALPDVTSGKIAGNWQYFRRRVGKVRADFI